MTRAAAIDCGTNSVRLLLVSGGGSGAVELAREVRITRLGQGVDATGEFHTDALTRTFAACDEFAEMIGAAGATRVRFVATSAARDARNRDAFFAGIAARLGVTPEIIDGTEEAALSFTGALTANPEVALPALVMDIGGGSTELVLGRPGELDRTVSLDVGSVRLRERFFHDDPPTAKQRAAATAFIDDLLDRSGIDFAATRTWFGVGGTATSLSAIAQGLAVYDRSRVHGSALTGVQLGQLADRLLNAPVAEVLAIPTMVPGRADVICGGALIAARVARRLEIDLQVSETDILDGVVLGLLEN